MQILRASDRTATPWRNGGGVTHEVAAWPPGTGAADFDWRISIANVVRGGPFSVFPGVDRELAVLAGELRLSIEGQAGISLSAHSPAVRFRGDVPTSGDPGARPVTDLNVMTRRGKFSSRMSRLTVDGRQSLAGFAGLAFLVALQPMRIFVRDREHSLSAYDAVRFDGGEGQSDGGGEGEITLLADAASVMVVEIGPAASG
jgi:hypothetical protein